LISGTSQRPGLPHTEKKLKTKMRGGEKKKKGEKPAITLGNHVKEWAIPKRGERRRYVIIFIRQGATVKEEN